MAISVVTRVINVFYDILCCINFFLQCVVFFFWSFFFFNLSIFGNPLEILNSVLFTGFQNNNNELKI